MKTITLRLAILSLFILCISCTEKPLIKEEITVQELATWKTLDKGQSTINGDELIVEEIEGSDGYFLISPKSYKGDMIINYKVKAMSESSVLIALFSVSDKGSSLEITLPPTDAKGRDFWDWRTHLEHYNLTFNNVSHGGNTPFFFKNETPFKRGFYQRKERNVARVGVWHDVEIGKQGKRLWFTLDEEIVFEQEDCTPLVGGHLILRISGTNGDKIVFAKAAIKDLTISHE